MEETKKRLDTSLLRQSTDGFIKSYDNCQQKIKSVTIADDLLQDKEQLEDYMILVMNKAIESK
jgi:DNA-binding protein YbaB